MKNPNHPSFHLTFSTDTSEHRAEMERRSGVKREKTPRLFEPLSAFDGNEDEHFRRRMGTNDGDGPHDGLFDALNALGAEKLGTFAERNAKKPKGEVCYTTTCDSLPSNSAASASTKAATSSLGDGQGTPSVHLNKSPSSPRASEIRPGDRVRCLLFDKWADGAINHMTCFVGDEVICESIIEKNGETCIRFNGRWVYPLRALEKVEAEETPASRGWVWDEVLYRKGSYILVEACESRGWFAYECRPSPVYLCKNGVFGSGMAQYFPDWREIDALLFETEPSAAEGWFQDKLKAMREKGVIK